jgi:hypothetical protein
MLHLVQMVFPAYRRALDALAPGAALELARNIVGALEVARAARREVFAVASGGGPHRFMVSVPGAPEDSEPAIQAKWAELQGMRGRLASLPVVEAELMQQIGPQRFRGKPVLGGYVAPSTGDDVIGYLVSEASSAVELVSIVVQIRDLSGAHGAVCPVLTAAQRQQIVQLVEPWKTRPINFAFLARALTELGIWHEIAMDKGHSGRTLAETQTAVAAQAKETGALADVGELDVETLTRMVGQLGSDDRALDLFERIRDAAPNARGPLVRQIDRLGKLSSFCDHLPFASVKQLHDAVAPFDAPAAQRLAPFFMNRGGARSMQQIYLDQVDAKLQQDQSIRAFGWFFLERLHNMATLGFEGEQSAAYEAHQAGLTTDDRFRSATTKALGKAALVGVASAATGGVAGEFGQGVAAGLGASRSTAQIIAGGVGGVASGLGGHASGDLYDQLLNGKQGFDSLGEYMQSGAMGGAVGIGLAGLSVASGGYLPASAQRPVDRYAQRFPVLGKALEDIRATGFRSGATVRMKVAQLVELVDAGFGGPGAASAFAPAGAYGRIRAWPPDTAVSVRLRPTPASSSPMQRVADEGELLEIEGVDPASGSIFDSYGDDASYADDIHDPSGNEPLADPDVAEDISIVRPERTGKPSPRRERYVAGRRMPAEMATENGMSVLDEARLDIMRSPRHHTLPQEHIKFFQERGFSGREIDRFTVQLDKLEHEMVHGGNQALARKHWPEREWNTHLMELLTAREHQLQLQKGPQAKISRETILRIMENARSKFDIAKEPYVHHRAPNTTLGKP